MPHRSPFRVLVVAVLGATLASAGCMDAARELVGDEDLEAQSAQSVTVRMAAENATENLSHLGLQIEGVFAHNASVTPPDGYHEMNLSAEHADLVVEGQGSQLRLASRTLPVGTYDQIVLRVGQTDVQTTGEASAGADDNASAEGNESSANESDEGHGHGDHAHGHGNESAGANESSAEGRAQAADGFDIPINVTFEVTSETSTSVQLILDAGASASGDGFEPSFARVEVARGGEVVEEIEDPDVGFREAQRSTPTGTPPPAARMTVFDGDGDKAYEPTFQAESGAFANSLSNAFTLNASLGFSATESEAVADGVAVESYRWDFGDNETATGLTTNHSYQEPGAYEVTLTVSDTFGVTDEHTVRIVVASWTEQLINGSFEGDMGNWTADNGDVNSWAADGPGYGDSSTSAHAGAHPHPPARDIVGFSAMETITLTSPNATIPEDWIQAGFFVRVQGEGGEHYDNIFCFNNELTVSYIVDGNEDSTTTVETFAGEVPEWVEIGGDASLNEVRGSDVTFVIEFFSGCDVPGGVGWYVDEVEVGGIPEDDFRNAHLLEEGGHGGHDHEH